MQDCTQYDNITRCEYSRWTRVHSFQSFTYMLARFANLEVWNIVIV